MDLSVKGIHSVAIQLTVLLVTGKFTFLTGFQFKLHVAIPFNFDL